MGPGIALLRLFCLFPPWSGVVLGGRDGMRPTCCNAKEGEISSCQISLLACVVVDGVMC